MILGLDVSTSFVGATILDQDGALVYCEAWDLRKIKNFFEKTETVENRLTDLFSSYKITRVYVEQSLQFMRTGLSSASTILLLAKFNGVVSWLCYEIFGVEPEYIAANSARAACKIRVPRGEKAKVVVLQFLLDNEPGFEVEYTTYGNPRPGSYDRSDSLIIAKAGYVKWNQISSKS